uniref:Uncharacterized protein n=1 Tax=Anguilla anguilla TaxID=7936 RepID=A0A0E9UJN0_ANGAN
MICSYHTQVFNGTMPSNLCTKKLNFL